MILCLYGLNDGRTGIKLLTGGGKVIYEGIVDLVLFHYYPEELKQGATVFIHVKEAEVFIMTREEIPYNVDEWHREEVEKLFENRKELLVLRVRT